MPDESLLVEFADDVVALTTEGTVQQPQRTLRMVKRRESRWMIEHALEKTGVVVLTKERVPTVLPIQIGETMIQLEPAVKYLGIMIDTEMSFFEQMLLLLQNVGDLPADIQCLLSAIQSSITFPKFELTQVQKRGPVQIMSAYRTVSEPAVVIIEEVIPFALHDAERRLIYLRKGEVNNQLVTCGERTRTLYAWQQS